MMSKLKSGCRRKVAGRAAGSVIEALENRVLLSAPYGTVTLVLSLNDDGWGDYTPNAFAIYAIDGTVNGTTVTPNSIAANGGQVDGGIDGVALTVTGATAGSLHDDLFSGTTYANHAGTGNGKLRNSNYYELTDSATESDGPSMVEAGFTLHDDTSTSVTVNQDVAGSPPSLDNVEQDSPSTLIIFGLGQSAGNMQTFATSTTGNNPAVPSGTALSGPAPASAPYSGPGTFEYAGNTYLSSLLVADGRYVTGTLPAIDTVHSSASLLAAYDEPYNSAIRCWNGVGADTALTAVVQTLPLVTTTTAVTSNNTSASYGQSVTFTATVTPVVGSGETGSVQFQIDGANVGSPVPLTGNTAAYTTSALSIGTRSIVAVYSGDENFSASISPIFPQSVGQAATTTAVTSSNGSASYGQSVTFTATVTPASGSGETGTVQFEIDGSFAGSSVPLSGNTAAYTTSTLGVGSHSVVAVYTVYGNFTGSTSPVFTQTIGKAATTNVVTTSNGSARYGQSVTFTATVMPTSGTGETGSVQFQIDGSNVGSPVAINGNIATITPSTLTAGSHFIVAVYGGSNNFAGSTSPIFMQTIGTANTTAAVTSSNGQAGYGQSVTFTATVTPTSGNGETGTVQFQIDGSNVGSAVPLVGNTAAYTTSVLSVGSHSIVAVYSGDSNFVGATSPAFIQGVIEVATTTAVTSLSTSAVYGQPVNLTATVTPASGSGETGTVQFRIDGSDFGSPVALSGNNAFLTTTMLSAGSHSIVAVYSGDSSFARSTSPAIPQNVAHVAPSTSLYMDTLVSSDIPSAGHVWGVTLDTSGNLFGTTYEGGANGYGVIFEVANGSAAMTTLVSFNGADGEWPYAGVIFDSAGDLFGTTIRGGANNDGTVFEIAQGGDVITTLASFNGANGSDPNGIVLDSSDDIFGTAYEAGANSDGTVFELARGTGAITTLAAFNGTNGAEASAAPVLDSFGDLFGTATVGGAHGDGTVFEVAHGSGAITTLVSLNGANGNQPDNVALDSSGNLFGATELGGNLTLNSGAGDGTVFEIAHGSAAVTTLASFNGTNGDEPPGVVMDSSGNLFGTTSFGGAGGFGTVFEMAQRSDAITTLASLEDASGAVPEAGVVLDSIGNIFGTTTFLGATGYGTVFELTRVGTAVTSGTSSPVYGQPVTFTATINPSVGVGPRGTVQFVIDGSDAGSPVALAGNTATYITSALNAGSHSVVAVYSGDTNYASMTSPAFAQNVAPAPLALAASAAYIKLAADGQHVDVWNNSSANGTPNQCLPCCDICGVNYTGPDGGDTFVLDFSNGDPIPAGGISLTGGAGQNTLEIVGGPANDADAVTIGGGSFTIPANTPGAGTMNYTLGAMSIAAGASLALAASDSQADQTVFAVNNLSVPGTLDIANNTLLASENNVSLSQVTAWVQNQTITSSLVAGPHAIASRALGYGDWTEDPFTIPAGDVEVKYVPTGDVNLDGVVNTTDLTRAINDLGLSPDYSGGDVLDLGVVNITDVTDIINNLGATLNASGDSASVATAMAPVKSAGRAIAPPAVSAAGASPFSDAPIQADWLTDGGSILSE